MGRVLSVAVSSCLLLVLATAAAAQSPPSPTPEQSRELDQWLAAMQKWQRFQKKWPNEAAHDPFGRIVGRMPRPETPAWLDPYCDAVGPEHFDEQPPRVATACRLEAGLTVDLQAEAIRTQVEAERADREKLQKNTFFSRVHLDGLWTTTSTDARFYGLIGSHISLVDIGRVQFFGPPGVMALSVPDGRGSRQIRMGYTWGMSVRLMDVRLFSPTKNLTLFLDMTKVWVVGTSYDRLQAGGFDLAGFSLAPRKKR